MTKFAVQDEEETGHEAPGPIISPTNEKLTDDPEVVSAPAVLTSTAVGTNVSPFTENVSVPSATPVPQVIVGAEAEPNSVRPTVCGAGEPLLTIVHWPAMFTLTSAGFGTTLTAGLTETLPLAEHTPANALSAAWAGCGATNRADEITINAARRTRQRRTK